MKSIFWATILVCACVQLAYAGDYPYLRVKDPSYLKIFINSQSCNVESEDIELVIDRIFRKSRIRPVEGKAAIGEIDYSVEMKCDVNRLGPEPYLIRTYFGTRTEELGFVALDTFLSGHGRAREKDTILKSLRYITEKQVRLFLRENTGMIISTK